jgi:hypothetical protein
MVNGGIMKTLYIEITTDEAVKRINENVTSYIKTTVNNYPTYEEVHIINDKEQHYKPLEVSDDFIKWDGGECPVNRGEETQVVYKDGTLNRTDMYHFQALWNIKNDIKDIIAYRVIKEASKQTDLISREKVIEIVRGIECYSAGNLKYISEAIDKINQIKSEGNNE